jgi:hypothetical protein
MSKSIVYCVALLIALHTVPVFAYMDPGGANLFLQLVLPIISLIVGFFVFVRRWLVTTVQHLFTRIKALFKG